MDGGGGPPHLPVCFYVHPLKCTHSVDFGARLGPYVTQHEQSLDSVFRALTKARNSLGHRLLTRNLSTVDPNAIDDEVVSYLSLLLGLSSDGSPIRRAIKFTWTSILGDPKQLTSNDARLEFTSVLLCYGIWLCGFAEHTITTSKDDEDSRKTAYHCLLKACGVFDLALESGLRDLSSRDASCLDYRIPFVRSLRNQALCQAQEITITRAIRLGHSDTLISKLCVEVVNKYRSAISELNSLSSDNERVAKFRTFLEFKSNLMSAFARAYQGLALNKDYSGGSSVASTNSAMNHVASATTLLSELGLPFSPDGTLDALFCVIKEAHRKCSDENSHVFYESVPNEPPALLPGVELAKPRVFGPIKMSHLWTPELHSSFKVGEVAPDPKAEEPIAFMPAGESDSAMFMRGDHADGGSAAAENWGCALY